MYASPSALLALWEAGRLRHTVDRALLLFAFARPEGDPDLLADVPLGSRNLALLRLRTALFGERMEAFVDCPGCGERQTFNLDSAGLSSLPETSSEPIELDGYRFRLPNSRDLAVLQAIPDEEDIATHWLQRCLLTAPADNAGELPDGLAQRLEPLLEKADPAASYTMLLDCPGCDRQLEQLFDVAAYLWEELEAYAVDLLGQVHRLALAYHWSEREILSLSASRRALYLNLLEQ